MEAPTEFLRTLFSALREQAVDVEGMFLDHVCYRVETVERYRELCRDLGPIAAMLGEQQIGGRPIATFRLHRPWHFHDRLVDVVEVPAPKVGSPYSEGYEHAEFVVPDLERFVARHGSLLWELTGMTKAHQAEARLRFGRISAKFHRRALHELIAAEQGDHV